MALRWVYELDVLEIGLRVGWVKFKGCEVSMFWKLLRAGFDSVALADRQLSQSSRRRCPKRGGERL